MKDIIHFVIRLCKYFEQHGKDGIAISHAIIRLTFEWYGDQIKAIEKELENER